MNEKSFKDAAGLNVINGILLPKFFWPTVRKNCSSDREELLKFEAEGREFAKILRSLKSVYFKKTVAQSSFLSKKLRSLEQFIQTVKGQNNFW